MGKSFFVRINTKNKVRLHFEDWSSIQAKKSSKFGVIMAQMHDKTKEIGIV